MENFTIKQSSPKLFFYLIVDIIVTLIFVLSTFVSFGINWVIFALCLLGSAYFFLRIVYNMRCLIKKTDVLVANEEGLFDNSNKNAVGMIKWQEIKNIEEIDFMGTKFIGVSLVDPEGFISKLNSAQAKNLRSNMKCKCPPVEIPTENMKGSLKENLASLTKVWQSHSSSVSSEKRK